jgi:hypothetical protein
MQIKKFGRHRVALYQWYSSAASDVDAIRECVIILEDAPVRRSSADHSTGLNDDVFADIGCLGKSSIIQTTTQTF